MTTIKTAYGIKTIVRRVGTAGEYYQQAPAPNAPHGGWWVLNLQRGFVAVSSNSRALLAALAADRGAR